MALAGPDAGRLGLRVAVFDPDPARAQGMLDDLGIEAPVAADLGGALSASPDLVVDLTGPHARLAIAGEALRGGALVICEPPLAPDEGTLALLMGAAARAPGRLVVAHRARHLRGLRQLAALRASGALGEARALTIRLRARESLHALLRGPAPDLLDAARAVLGTDALSARASPPDGPEAGVAFDMADGSTLSLLGCAGGDPPGPEGDRYVGDRYVGDWHEGDWHLVGARGETRWDGGAVRAWAGGTPLALPEPAWRPRGPAGVLHEVVAALRAGRAPLPSARDSAASLLMAFAARRSAARGGRPEPARGLASDASASFHPRAARRRAAAPATLTEPRRWT
jgi:predicted dehydrogenase